MPQKTNKITRERYDNADYLPNSNWRVHDTLRPQPKIITPGSCSTQDKPGQPPSDAIVLFDGEDSSKWLSSDGKEIRWLVENGVMKINGTGDIKTKDSFGDLQLHIEWASPLDTKGNGQNRGNSGIFLMDKYEIQILDGYNNYTYADGLTAAIYGQYPPIYNACRKPGKWQTYEIFFFTPCFEKGRLVTPAYVTVIHNSVLVHYNVEILGSTRHGSLPSYEPHPPKGSIRLQDHGAPVCFRNIWIRELEKARVLEFVCGNNPVA
jgi:hypothetical protein